MYERRRRASALVKFHTTVEEEEGIFLNIRMSLTGVNCLVYMYWSSTVIVEYLQNILKCKLPFKFIKLTKKGGVSKE